MTTRILSFSSGFGRLVLASALICSMSAFSDGVRAQEQGATQQLPDSLVNQQTPPAFPQDQQQSPAQTSGSAKKASTPAASNNAQTAAPSATVQESAGGERTAQTSVVENKEAAAPKAENIPAQPETRKLVPSTPMGVAAQNVASGQTSASAQSGAGESADMVNLENDVAPPPPLPDILEEYAVPAEPAEQEQAAQQAGADIAQDGEALPEVNTVNMVKLKGNFPNSNKNVTVPISTTTGGEGLQPSKTDKELREEIRTEAYDAAITGMFPLSPDQIKTLVKKYDETQKIATTPPYDAPKPEITVQNISLDPGVPPPVVKTAVGNVTTINMLDATGAPWPVQDVTWAGDFEIVEPEEGGHIVRITPMAQFARGNIVVRLLTLKTPLTLTLETSRDVVQYRIDARIPEYGPFANAPLMQGPKSTLVAGSPDLTSLLDGVMPSGMQKLMVMGVDGRTTAYSMGGTTYVRTPLTLLSPAWQSSVSSADGMNVYALSNAPVLLLSDSGEFMRATLKEKEDLLDE